MKRSTTKESRTQRNYRLPNDLIECLEKHAAQQGIKITSLVETLLRQGIELASSSDPTLGKLRVSEIENAIDTVKLLEQRLFLLEAHVSLLLQHEKPAKHVGSATQLPITTSPPAQSAKAVASDQNNNLSRALKPHEAHKIAQKHGYKRTIKALSALAKSSPDPEREYARWGLRVDLSLRGKKGQSAAWFFAIDESDLSSLDEQGISSGNDRLLESRELPEEFKAIIDFNDYDANGWLCLAGAYKIACKNGYAGTVSTFKAIAHKRNAESEYNKWGLEIDWNRRRSKSNPKSYWLRPILEEIE